MINRRLLLGSAIAAIGASTFPQVVRAGSEQAVSIGDTAKDAGIVFGTSIAQDAVDDPDLGALYRRHARIYTADWAMKLEPLWLDAETFDPSLAENLVRFANDAGTPIRGHALAWNEIRPDWLMRMTRKEMRRFLDRHVTETAAHFAGRLHSWDVVNEPFWPGHGLPGGWRDGPFLAAFGEAYVERCFKRAAEADPGTPLVLNEAHCEQWTETGAGIRKGLLGLVDRLLDAGVPLHAVGLQGHLQPQWAYDDAGFADFLHEIGERGVEIYISEFDVNDEPFPEETGARDAAVAGRYRDFLSTVLSVPAVTTVITWQLSDRASWYKDTVPPDAQRRPRPLPFDDRLRPKPAYDALIETFDKPRIRRSL